MKDQEAKPKADKTVQAKSANLGQKEARAEKKSEEQVSHMGEKSGQSKGKTSKSPTGKK